MSGAQKDGGGRDHGTLARAWEVLVARAREGRTITYGEMATALVLSPQSSQFTELLNELSRAEEAAGRGLLSVLVVRKRQGTPGMGFFNLARELGRKFENEKVFYLEESERVVAQWQGRPAEELDILHDAVIKELERLYFSSHDEGSASSGGTPTRKSGVSAPEKGNPFQAFIRGVARIVKR